MRKLPLQWLLHEIAGDLENDLRFQATAIVAQQEATEVHILSLFQDTTRADIHAKRVATMGKNIALAKRLRGRRHWCSVTGARAQGRGRLCHGQQDVRLPVPHAARLGCRLQRPFLRQGARTAPESTAH